MQDAVSLIKMHQILHGPVHGTCIQSQIPNFRPPTDLPFNRFYNIIARMLEPFL